MRLRHARARPALTGVKPWVRRRARFPARGHLCVTLLRPSRARLRAVLQYAQSTAIRCWEPYHSGVVRWRIRQPTKPVGPHPLSRAGGLSHSWRAADHSVNVAAADLCHPLAQHRSMARASGFLARLTLFGAERESPTREQEPLGPSRPQPDRGGSFPRSSRQSRGERSESERPASDP